MQAWPDPTAEEHEQDDAHGGHEDTQPLSWIEPAEGAAVRVPTEALPDVEVGSTLAVTVGGEITDEASQEQGIDPAVAVQAATVVQAVGPDPTTASAGSAPTNVVTAVLVLPAGASPDGTSIGTVVDTLNGAVSSFWSEQSNGTVRIAAVQGAAGWVSSAQACSSAFALWSDVAQQIGWTGGAGKHLMLYVPSNAPGCAYGLGTVGSSIGSGGRSYVQAAALSVMAHELGHNFGLGHSSEVQCDGAIESSTCQTRPYFDFYDVMGISWSQVGTLNVAQAARLGFLPSNEVVALSPSSAATTATLVPVSAGSGTRAISLTAADSTVYYLEYRQASGRDSWLGGALNEYGLDSGVVLRRAASGSDTSLLLDGTPSRSSGWSSDMQQALRVGAPASVADDQFVVTVNSTTASGASISVSSGRSPISVAWTASGGTSGLLGGPVAAESCGLRSGGCWRPYQGGAMYSTPSTGAHYVRGAIRDLWSAAGSETGWLGYPTSDETCGLRAGGCVTFFEHGSIWWSPATGAQMVSFVMHAGMQVRGWEAGGLGYPVAGVSCGGVSYGCSVPFQGGTLVWSPANGARLLVGPVRDLWQAMGGGAGWLGYPVQDQVCGLAQGGCLAFFGAGSIWWSPATGAHAVNYVMHLRWQAMGWEAGALGYPVGDVSCGGASYGCSVTFQGGSLYWSPAGGARFVRAAILQRWAANGAQTAWLGYPISDEACTLPGGGCFNSFQGGDVLSSPTTGAHTLVGGMRKAWADAGGAGAWGMPVTDTVCNLPGGGCWQSFQWVSVYWDARTGPAAMSDQFRAAYAAAGGADGRLGSPTGDQTCTDGRCTQQFQGGTLVSTAGGAVRIS
jgi:uncharacterized protein with LGFP repeats